MERLHTQGGEAVGARRWGGWGEGEVVVVTTRVPVYCPLSLKNKYITLTFNRSVGIISWQAVSCAVSKMTFQVADVCVVWTKWVLETTLHTCISAPSLCLHIYLHGLSVNLYN